MFNAFRFCRFCGSVTHWMKNHSSHGGGFGSVCYVVFVLTFRFASSSPSSEVVRNLFRVQCFLEFPNRNRLTAFGWARPTQDGRIVGGFVPRQLCQSTKSSRESPRRSSGMSWQARWCIVFVQQICPHTMVFLATNGGFTPGRRRRSMKQGDLTKNLLASCYSGRKMEPARKTVSPSIRFGCSCLHLPKIKDQGVEKQSGEWPMWYKSFVELTSSFWIFVAKWGGVPFLLRVGSSAGIVVYYC